MTMDWWVERFGTIGLMLAAMVWDRHRLLEDLKRRDQRIEELADRLIEQSQKSLDEQIQREVKTIAHLEQISSAIRQGVRQ
ncbi:hypothetical protein [uncultured Salipiger sp.]|uniref:hypothetical protein n=1 Tax=uncultured Salipiger sp. TaxID=499810 RepID=UPI002592985C|nr:hypothetical protein [uncultured Salipiger sp.]